MGISENIKFLRKNTKLTQKQLAQKANLSIATIQGYEQGKYEPKKEALYKLCNALDCNINEILDKPFDLSDGIYIKINDLNELPQKLEELTCKRQLNENIKSEDYFEVFLCYLESLGYKLSVIEYDEMIKMHITPECEDDFYIGIQDNTRDNVTFFHKMEFMNFQKEVEKTIDYEIYKQFKK